MSNMHFICVIVKKIKYKSIAYFRLTKIISGATLHTFSYICDRQVD